jgi:hypothetical protein
LINNKFGIGFTNGVVVIGIGIGILVVFNILIFGCVVVFDWDDELIIK